MQRRHLMTMFCALCVTSTANAQEASEAFLGMRIFELRTEVDQKLLSFCVESLLRERGLAVSPFAGTTDEWILKRFESGPELSQSLDNSKASKEPPLELAEEGKPAEANRKAERFEPMQAVDAHSRLLKQRLNAHQLAMLPYAHLYREGLVALCRPEFRSIFETEESQDTVRQLVVQAWSKNASKVHRAIFGQKDRSEVALLEFELRRISFQLECDIVSRLSEVERERLANVVSSNPQLHFEIARGTR